MNLPDLKLVVALTTFLQKNFVVLRGVFEFWVCIVLANLWTIYAFYMKDLYASLFAGGWLLLGIGMRLSAANELRKINES